MNGMIFPNFVHKDLEILKPLWCLQLVEGHIPDPLTQVL